MSNAAATLANLIETKKAVLGHDKVSGKSGQFVEVNDDNEVMIAWNDGGFSHIDISEVHVDKIVRHAAI